MIMGTLTTIGPLFHLCGGQNNLPIQQRSSNHHHEFKPFFTCFSTNNNNNAFSSTTTFFHRHRFLSHVVAASEIGTPIVESSPHQCSDDLLFTKIFPIKRTQMMEGMIFVRLDQSKELRNWELTVGCNLPGKWILHWGVSYVDDIGREWDKPPCDMIPPGSVTIKDYAIETPLKKSSISADEGDTFYEVKIDLKPDSKISTINFVLKDGENGAWHQYKGRDFKVPLPKYLKTPKRGFSLWPGGLTKISNILLKSITTVHNDQDKSSELINPKQENGQLEDFCIEVPITKEIDFNNSVTVSVKKCYQSETLKNVLYLETDLPGDIVLHWGLCRGNSRRWEVPPGPHPPGTVPYKDKALRSQLQAGDSTKGSSLQITLGEGFSGFAFVLKQNETWFKCMGNDFYVSLLDSNSIHKEDQPEGVEREVTKGTSQEASFLSFTDGIFGEIRNLVTDISANKNRKIKSKEPQESILQEIERLAAEAYNMFKSSVSTFSDVTSTLEPEATVVEPEAAVVEPEPAVGSRISTLVPKVCSAEGTGYEILCQGFNWESHKSGRWYVELKDKASELASLGFTVVWLPPCTESVSPEGYMPRDLYNLNSRYGNIDELKDLVKKFHELGIKTLGDAVLNHRCAHYQNPNGVWNLFGGRLNWDERAIVADDPHFQGRGNKSSGENFDAAPNIDHSQEFVRKDIIEWLCWLRKEVGYDGWRLDFARGFWGGYVKDYIQASDPYFAVGEFWDSLSYTDGELDHNQDAHRQRIVDWINATNGTAGAFDVTTKGILHSAFERCEYWRLSDSGGNPPGVMGWWPSHAVTFIENHDTGSTQGHWRFPSGKEMEGYAYILTHPGTPSVFLDHIFSHNKTEVGTLISIRTRNKIHCRSVVQIVKAEWDVYASIIDEKIAMKIGPGYFEPPAGSQNWSLAIAGRDYKIWEAK
ncbi:alpha-amylase 3, chloroplastic-like [Arachis stenosperma]|uniref:alpha-amylase 3, chloroplastic-like n=1 Tax=Arachis stenosperma TaxID=217475 RepID=UPI0025AC021E|nr:alpha-amylase 3, chloroplastic-like [Arachis stenosperma]